MTQITGKIFPMYDKTGQNRRFPETVIEAVLGLSSYLQNQFSSLADIYMPIGGIYQSQTGQEFVYRATPNTIKAKSLTLDRIKGKTLAWNQLVNISAFPSSSAAGTTLTVVGNKVRINGTATQTYDYYSSAAKDAFIAGHKYLLSHRGSADIKAAVAANGGYPSFVPNADTILTVNTLGEKALFIEVTNGITYNDAEATFNIIDLTASGLGDITAAQFRALYHDVYYPYNSGTLISNDADAVETTGVNQWDEEWEVGGMNADGTPSGSITSRIRSKNFSSIIGGQTYYIKIPNSSGVTIYWYDSEKSFISYSAIYIAGGSVTAPSNAAYFKINPQPDYGTTYNHDICINLSNAAINGQYFPYWKRTLNLGLNEFKVKDGQGNITTITGGLKSAGSVYDEIVGNKYIRYVATRAYQSGDENNNTVTTDGHEYTNYPLATPIEYDLVEPLIYTTKAGTTEERISPNSDGLSAPFCCDITYSASENNDSESAQYAATAGRLLNTRKIWGQDFNGSEDVNGNLVSNGILQGTQLKSTVPTGTAPLVVSSTTTVANLVAEKASKLLTARSIWGRSFDGSDNISGALEGVTTISTSGLATIAGGIALGTSANAQTARLVWDETNNAWHLQGNLYVDGFVTAGGINNQE